MVRADLVTDAEALLRPEWLTAQRWYGANDRQLVSVSLVDAAALPSVDGGSPQAWLLVAEAGFADGGTLRYLVPAVADATSGLHEPADGEGAWRRLTTAIATASVLAGDTGTFRCDPSPAGEDSPDGLPSLAELSDADERRMGVEQTNTSVVIGDGLILKIYRRLQPGENPELEVGAFLQSVGCPVTPRMLGVARYLNPRNGTCAAAMLQERVTTSGDAWNQMLETLRDVSRGARAAEQTAASIGSVTARLHACLASRPQDLAFPARPARTDEIAGLRTGAVSQLEGALTALDGEDRERLGTVAPALRDRLDAAFTAASSVTVQRIHGDYHLGQLLATGSGYMVIDFEGEPARPLAERRAPQPAERDVAGMLRSFDYAVRTVGRQSPSFDADVWLARARDAFLAAYAVQAPRPLDTALLAAFELEKACYEVRYEAANRPEWTWLPLDALRRLAERG